MIHSTTFVYHDIPSYGDYTAGFYVNKAVTAFRKFFELTANRELDVQVSVTHSEYLGGYETTQCKRTITIQVSYDSSKTTNITGGKQIL